jgi:hypothetical protein
MLVDTRGNEIRGPDIVALTIAPPFDATVPHATIAVPPRSHTRIIRVLTSHSFMMHLCDGSAITTGPVDTMTSCIFTQRVEAIYERGVTTRFVALAKYPLDEPREGADPSELFDPAATTGQSEDFGLIVSGCSGAP